MKRRRAGHHLWDEPLAVTVPTGPFTPSAPYPCPTCGRPIVDVVGYGWGHVGVACATTRQIPEEVVLGSEVAR